jgi:uncharacterized membrane protein YuzA (DUF378 family)
MATVDQYVPERRHIPERRTMAAQGQGRIEREHIMNAVDWIATALLFIGGLNWGLVGLFDLNVVETLFGEATIITRAIYVLVGLSALYFLYTASKMSRTHT